MPAQLLAGSVYATVLSSHLMPDVMVSRCVSVRSLRRGSASGTRKSPARYGISLTSAPGRSPRPIAIPMSAEVTLLLTDCIVCRWPC